MPSISEWGRGNVINLYFVQTAIYEPDLTKHMAKAGQEPLGRHIGSEDPPKSSFLAGGWRQQPFPLGSESLLAQGRGFGWDGKVTLCLYKLHQAGFPVTSWMGAFLQNSLSMFSWTISRGHGPLVTRTAENPPDWNDTSYCFRENGTHDKAIHQVYIRGSYMLSLAITAKTCYNMSTFGFKRISGHLEESLKDRTATF